MKNFNLPAMRTDVAPGDNGHATLHNDAATRVNALLTGVPSKLSELENDLNLTSPVTSVAGKTGAVSLVKADVGLSNVDNTSDANKPVSTATATALSGKASLSHTHVAADVTDFSEALNARISAGANVTTSYNPTTKILTISATGGSGSVVVDGESVQDALAGRLIGTNGVTINNDDAADTITFSLSGVTVSQLTDVSFANIRTLLKATTNADARAAIFAADVNHTHADLSTWAAVNRIAAKNPQDMADTTGSKVITYDSNNAPTAHDVIWPDGGTGAYTATTVSTAFPGAVDAYTITYLKDSVSRTYTQPAVTRNASGYVTKRPQLTVVTN